jgi:hypothetical protein
MSNDEFQSETGGQADNRRFERHDLGSTVTVFDGERRRQGRVKDVSGSGAMLEMGSELESMDGPPEVGRYIDMEIEALSYMGAEVVRHAGDDFAVRFDLDDGECQDLAEEISSFRTGMAE